mmetsp:Transcript_19693/g.44964  ORF Transcript_19693/g.44964 Transcript_19693/m.44964 type:complete len:102 (-) Transcript_19693:298-603(-)
MKTLGTEVCPVLSAKALARQGPDGSVITSRSRIKMSTSLNSSLPSNAFVLLQCGHLLRQNDEKVMNNRLAIDGYSKEIDKHEAVIRAHILVGCWNTHQVFA